mmetsp:Transcript_39128/g.116898  ORF Transcript_39128/g.116898 Transcript_39128/m.116898 type:complete len:228 (-) Transcript_39128:518-1201(-)
MPTNNSPHMRTCAGVCFNSPCIASPLAAGCWCATIALDCAPTSGEPWPGMQARASNSSTTTSMKRSRAGRDSSPSLYASQMDLKRHFSAIRPPWHAPSLRSLSAALRRPAPKRPARSLGEPSRSRRTSRRAGSLTARGPARPAARRAGIALEGCRTPRTLMERRAATMCRATEGSRAAPSTANISGCRVARRWTASLTAPSFMHWATVEPQSTPLPVAGDCACAAAS